jgi:hypothetical protein
VQIISKVTLAVEPRIGFPPLRAGPFALTYFGPEAIGGFAPNRVYGLPEYLGFTTFYGAPLSASARRAEIQAFSLGRQQVALDVARRDVASASTLSTIELQFQLRENLAGYNGKLPSFIVIEAQARELRARGVDPGILPYPPLEIQLTRAAAASGNFSPVNEDPFTLLGRANTEEALAILRDLAWVAMDP